MKRARHGVSFVLFLILGAVAGATDSDKLVFTQSSLDITSGKCADYQVAAENLSGVILSLSGTHGANLSTSGISGTFYSDSACSKAITILDLGPSSISGDANPHTFYFKASASGEGSLLASMTGYDTAETSKITVDSPPSYYPAVTSQFFGMHFASAQNWPTVDFDTDMPQGVSWYALEKKSSSGVISYDFSSVDGWLDTEDNHGKKYVIYNVLHTPQWEAFNPTQPCSGSTTGCASPPKDLNTDGTGSDQIFINFVTALAKNSAARGAAGQSKINAYQLWNEPNGPNFGDPGSASPGYFSGTYAQMARMAYDLYTITRKYDPGTLILSPGVAEPGYPCISGKGAPSGCAQNWIAGFLSAKVSVTGKTAASYVDVVAWHGYLPIYVTTMTDTVVENMVDEVTSIRAAMSANGASGKPLWNTEGSWGDNEDLPAGEQADFMSRWLILQAANGVEKTMWYLWDYSSSLSEDLNTGTLYNPTTGVYSPAVGAFTDVQDWISGASFLPCTTPISSGSIVWACDLLLAGGAPAQIVWTSESTYTKTVSYPTSFKTYTHLGESTTEVKDGSVVVSPTPTLLK